MKKCAYVGLGDTTIKYTGKVKWNGNHYFAGDEVMGQCIKDGTGRVFIIDECTSLFGSKYTCTVEVDKSTVQRTSTSGEE
jgi:hypothetical protein